jgi:hypothetical protein
MMKRLLDQFPARAVVYTFIAEHPTRDAASDRRLFHPEERFRATAPKFALRPDGAVYIEKPAQRLEDLVQSQVWAGFRVAWFRKGPPPTLALTRALVLAMKEYAESRGARYYLVDWAQGASFAPQSCFADLPVRLIDTRLQQPPGWDTWLVPGDGHPDRRAHAHVAGLLATRLAQEAGH